ncbi:hypothetical protein [Calidifontibacter terrae]
MWPYIATLLPSIGVLYLFYVIMKHILEGDRRERIAQAQWENAHDLSEKTSAESPADPQ